VTIVSVQREIPRLVLVMVLLGAGALSPRAHAADSPWKLPPPDNCAPQGGLRALGSAKDAPRASFKTGDTFSVNELEALRDFLPPSIWEYRDRFFYAGMRLEIGACFADYSAPDFFQEATTRHAGEARITQAGGIEGYQAGLPFPPGQVSPTDPEAGQKWAWNFALRYQGAGFWGKFRTTDMVGRDGRAEPFLGEIFKAQIAFRSDRAKDGYQAPAAKGKHWVAGGQLFEPFDARHFSWRQYRDVAHLTEVGRSDDVHAYLPDFRRVRRVSGADVEGLYMPSFSVGVVKPTAIAGVGGGIDGGGGAGGGSVGAAPAASSITTKRSGFEGLEMRPNLYDVKLLGVQDVIAPINAASASYPTEKEREFGPWGLSFASDRWDLRRAVVIEGVVKKDAGGHQVARFIQYLDAQTLAPLYYASWDPRGEQVDVGIHVGRWSEERENYPPWPHDPDKPVRVIDSVGAGYANILDDGGWRRESWELVATPPDDRTLKRELSVNNLTKRH